MGSWQAGLPSTPDGEGHPLWLKLEGASGPWKDPRLVFYPSVPVVALYKDGTEVREETLNELGHDPRFVTEWSAMPLQPEEAGGPLILRLDRLASVPWAIEMAESADWVTHLFRSDLLLFVSFMILLFLGLVAIGLYAAFPREPLHLILALFAWCLSLNFLVRIQSKSLFLTAPDVYFALGIAGAVGWPIFALLFFERVVHPSLRNMTRALWVGYGSLCAVAIGCIAVEPKAFHFLENGLMMLVVQALMLAIVVLIVLSIRRESKNVEYSFFLFAFTVYFLDFATAIALPVQGGGVASSLALALGFTAVMLRRYWATQREVQQLNAGLERKVQDRTEALTQAIADRAAMEERNRVAHEIHDVVGHTLTGAIVQLEAGQLLLGRDPDQAQRKVETAQELVRKGLDDIRASVRMLRDDAWSEPIIDLMQRAALETEHHADVEIRQRFDANLPELSSSFKSLLYSALLEGISNGIRHGGSRAFEVELTREKDRLRFRLRNEGRPYAGEEFGFGLQALRGRAERLGGTFGFRSNGSEGGAVLEIFLPLHDPAI
ncbi:sensor histidine kinase [Paenibacillus antri]|nr:histidine kinase [Paenibacillus antri]